MSNMNISSIYMFLKKYFPYIVYCTGIFLVPLYTSQIQTDGISYITIAEKYAVGNFLEAINGYWGPLYSWIIALFLKLSINPLVAIKVIGLLVGLVGVVVFARIIKLFQFNQIIETTLRYVSIPLFWYFGFSETGADQLFLVGTLCYLNVVLQEEYWKSFKLGIVSSLYGVLLYYTKSYGLPFFLTHFFLLHAIELYACKDKRQRIYILKRFAIGVSIFGALITPWVVLISSKYGTVSFGTAGKYNLNLVGPSLGVDTGHPIYHQFIPPPNVTASSAWEDPTYIEIQKWSMFESKDELIHTLKNVVSNLHRSFVIFRKISVFSFTVILISAFCFLRDVHERRNKKVWNMFLILGVLYAGYLFIFIDERYVWLAHVLAVVLAGYCLECIWSKLHFSSRALTALTVVVGASFLAVPATILVRSAMGGQKNIHQISEAIKNTHTLQGKKVGAYHDISNNQNNSALTYLTGSVYYGMTSKDITEDELQKELVVHDIDYFLVWDAVIGSEKFPFLETVKHSQIQNLSIYKIQ